MDAIRIFRHPALVFWTLLSLFGVVGLTVAYATGNSQPKPDVGVSSAVTEAQIMTFRSLVGELVALMDDDATLDPAVRDRWVADATAFVVAAEESSPPGPVTQAWEGARAAVDEIAEVDVSDPDAVRTAVSRLAVVGDRLATLSATDTPELLSQTPLHLQNR